MLDVIRWIIKWYLLLLMLTFPISISVEFWSRIVSLTKSKKQAETKNYFEPKAWFPGNERLRCDSEEICRSLSTDILDGKVEYRFGSVLKCRGTWYFPYNLTSYESCVRSLEGFSLGSCKVADPFCVQEERGKILWNSPYVSIYPNQYVVKNKPLPKQNLLDEEREFLELSKNNTNVIWLGYQTIQDQSVWRDLKSYIPPN